MRIYLKRSPPTFTDASCFDPVLPKRLIKLPENVDGVRGQRIDFVVQKKTCGCVTRDTSLSLSLSISLSSMCLRGFGKLTHRNIWVPSDAPVTDRPCRYISKGSNETVNYIATRYLSLAESFHPPP